MAFKLRIVKSGNSLAVEMHHAAGIKQQPLTILGQAVGPPIAIEQRLSDPLLQPAHLHGNGRLRLEHGIRSARETARIGNGDESL
ncbi:Transcriptional regulatory protein, lysr family [Brucella melitensis NI]|nr:Transcriptional regulatory protein, lysr family [Brucella melitensis NI]